MRRNVAEKLRELCFPASFSKEILRDIFGRRQGDVLIEGLIDSVDEADFDHRLQLLEKKWSARERSELHTNIFSPWLRKYKYLQIKYSMIRSVRQAAGMGHLPEHFTTNASESINSVPKSKVDYKLSELLIFVTRLNEFVNEQTEEIEKAVINQGKYKLKKEYGYLHIQESKWFKMSQNQRETHVKKLHTTVISSEEVQDPSGSLPAPPQAITTEYPACFEHCL